jgi:hypothetical protein
MYATCRVHLILLYMLDVFMFRSDLAVKQLVCHLALLRSADVGSKLCSKLCSNPHNPSERKQWNWHCCSTAILLISRIQISSISLKVSVFWICVLVRGSNPGGDEIFSTCPDRPWGPPSLLYNGYRVFPGGKVRPVRAADHSPPSSAVVMEE